jgi:hypothetical protein
MLLGSKARKDALMSETPLTDDELDSLEALIDGASPGPWKAWVETRLRER